jgi:hypothetical protein
MIHLIPVIRIYLPTVLLEFFKIFKYCNLEGIAFGQWQFNRAVDNEGFTKNHTPVSYNFERMDYDTKAFFTLTADIWVF